MSQLKQGRQGSAQVPSAEIVCLVNPAALAPLTMTLPTHWEEP